MFIQSLCFDYCSQEDIKEKLINLSFKSQRCDQQKREKEKKYVQFNCSIFKKYNALPDVVIKDLYVKIQHADM